MTEREGEQERVREQKRERTRVKDLRREKGDRIAEKEEKISK